MEGRVIAITSGKGGVGKTTATASLGAALALEGKRVAVVDMDIGLRNLDVIMGLENRIVFTIVDAVKGRCRIMQSAIKDRRIENLYLIPASQSDNKDAINPEDMVRLCKKLRNEFDYTVLDCPAGIEQGFENTIAGSDEAIVVCTPEVSSVRDADRVIGLLNSRSITSKIIINRIMPQLVERGDMLNHQDVIDILCVELIGLVQQDDQVIISANTGIPLVLQQESKAGQAFRRIAMRLNGLSSIPIEIPQSNSGFWKAIAQKIGMKNRVTYVK
ncbi:MAG: septum site-determining protein MinD [Desulfobacterales bacterium]|nr:septum site-determining protein MinD [Desulfobacterales bacterium]